MNRTVTIILIILFIVLIGFMGIVILIIARRKNHSLRYNNAPPPYKAEVQNKAEVQIAGLRIPIDENNAILSSDTAEELIANIQVLFHLCIHRGIPLMARDGFLLGIVRHEGFITYDLDPDVMIYEKDLHLLKSIASWSNNHFSFNMLPTRDDVFYIHQGKLMVAEGVLLVDSPIPGVISEGRHHTGGELQKELWWGLYGHSKEEEGRLCRTAECLTNQIGIYSAKKDDFFPLQTAMFHGRDVIVPANAVNHVRAQYGPDVMTMYFDKWSESSLRPIGDNPEALRYDADMSQVCILNCFYRMVICSGPHVDHIGNNNQQRDSRLLYSSFHLPEFTCTNALRNTTVLFREFEIGFLDGMSILDLGSNIGGFSFECLNRGAGYVCGIEINQERIDVCSDLASCLRYSDRADFHRVDISKVLLNPISTQSFIDMYDGFDVVVCKAIDAYFTDPLALYQLVANLTRTRCYFETNSHVSPEEFMSVMTSQGFKTIEHLGTSESDEGFGRNSFILDKRPLIQKRTDSGFVSRVFQLSSAFFHEYCDEQGREVLHNLRKITHLRCIPKVLFSQNGYEVQALRGNLEDTKFSLEDKEDIKVQIIEAVININLYRLAHRDLHIRNMFYDKRTLYIIDYEFLTKNPVPLPQSYDLTGRGLPSPLSTSQMNIFHDSSLSVKNFLQPLSISLEDFTMYADKVQ